MLELKSSELLNWKQLKNLSPKYCAPAHIDIQCPQENCGSDLVNSPLKWEVLGAYLGHDGACNKCGSKFHLLIFNAPIDLEEESKEKAKVYIFPKLKISSGATERIRVLSPKFDETYSQSKQAERLGLHLLVGVGLRKSLEYLVKDYLLNHKKIKEDTIRKSTLSQCIQNFIENETIKSCTERAAWLGNDETHYYRKHEDRDLLDLKKLIELTLHWIETELITEEYHQGIQKKP